MLVLHETEPATITFQDRLDDNARRQELYQAAWKAQSLADPAAPPDPPSSLFRRLRVEHESRDNLITWGY